MLGPHPENTRSHPSRMRLRAANRKLLLSLHLHCRLRRLKTFLFATILVAQLPHWPRVRTLLAEPVILVKLRAMHLQPNPPHILVHPNLVHQAIAEPGPTPTQLRLIRIRARLRTPNTVTMAMGPLFCPLDARLLLYHLSQISTVILEGTRRHLQTYPNLGCLLPPNRKSHTNSPFTSCLPTSSCAQND